MIQSEKRLRIYSFYYQPKSILYSGNVYLPVWAGKNNKPNITGFIGDDTGENISEKNKYYSELSGIYWVWKNTHTDIVGSCHYRRYFTSLEEEPFTYRIKRLLYYPAGLWKKRYGLIYTSNFDYWKPKILNESEVLGLLDTYDAILPVRRILKQSIKNHYKSYHNQEDLIVLGNILEDYFPDYILTFDKVLNDNRLFANNMFILRWELFDKMMNWLFFILFKFEERVNLNEYKDYQERIFGFLSERLITVWIIHNKINFKELPLIYFKKLKKQSNA
jgi:hypothetical protein